LPGTTEAFTLIRYREELMKLLRDTHLYMEKELLHQQSLYRYRSKYDCEATPHSIGHFGDGGP